MLRVFAIRIQQHFRFEPEWYRTGVVAGLVLQYYALLRSAIRTRAKLRPCLTRCWHCGIFFVVAACNVGRKVGCPFGCADTHRKRQWQQTSREYSRSVEGKRKKSTSNQRRRNRVTPAETPEPCQAPQPAPEIPSSLVGYVQRVVSAIERRPVSREEIVAMLCKEKRQHGLVRQRRMDGIIRSLHERPP